jgi:hypothetical protein
LHVKVVQGKQTLIGSGNSAAAANWYRDFQLRTAGVGDIDVGAPPAAFFGFSVPT